MASAGGAGAEAAVALVSPGQSIESAWQRLPSSHACTSHASAQQVTKFARKLAADARQGWLGPAGSTAGAALLACRSLLREALPGFSAASALCAVLLALNLATCSAASASILPASAQQQQVTAVSLNQLQQPTSRFAEALLAATQGSTTVDRASQGSWRWFSAAPSGQTASTSSSLGLSLTEQLTPASAADDGWQEGRGGGFTVVVASEAEDKLLELVRQVETRVGSAVGSVTSILEGSENPAQANAMAKSLIREVWEVVDQNYLDARSSGFDRGRWRELRDAALSQQYGSTAAVYRAVREMLAYGVSDPYCRFIPPSELAAMKKYDVTGVGLNLGTAEEYVRKTGRPLPPAAVGFWSPGDEGVFVVGISKGSASDQAGIQQGDQILKVDGKSLVGMSPFQASSLIQGQEEAASAAQGPVAAGLGALEQQQQQPRSFVTLQVRKPDGAVDEKRIERPVKTILSPVTSRIIKAGMVRPETTGMLRLTSFNARAHRDLEQAITQLEASGAQTLVLDLRDNRGGLVSEGLEVARLFLGPGQPIVVTESRAGPAAQEQQGGQAGPKMETSSSGREEVLVRGQGQGQGQGPSQAVAGNTKDVALSTALLPGSSRRSDLRTPPPPPATSVNTVPMAERPPLTRLPLTLLVNDHTASAAEIVAGALKDNCRAVLVGSQTYGKGLIQSVYELSDGSGLVVTVGKYLTPSRIDIDRFGIRPNFTMQPTAEQFDEAINACLISKEHDVLSELAAPYRQKQVAALRLRQDMAAQLAQGNSSGGLAAAGRS